jgi:hypothetical protein
LLGSLWVVPRLALLPLILVSSSLSHVEDPIPDRIGLDDLISLAGTGGVLAGVAFIAASASKRDKAIRWGALIGFGFGAVLYLVSLVAQVVSSL